MTVNTIDSRVPHSGNGSSRTFAVPFYFLLNADLKVYVDGVQKTLTTHYSVSGAGNANGGSITFVTAPAAGNGNVVVIRDPDLKQSTRYPSNDPFPAKTHETALDKLTMLVQRTRDLLARTLTLAEADASNVNVVLPTAQANALIGWNADATGLANHVGGSGDGSGGLTLPLATGQGGTGGVYASFAALCAAIKAALGLGSAATLNGGSAAGNVLVLDASARLPAVDGSQLSNLPVPPSPDVLFFARGVI